MVPKLGGPGVELLRQQAAVADNLVAGVTHRAVDPELGHCEVEICVRARGVRATGDRSVFKALAARPTVVY